MQKHPLDPLLRPRSIAFVGASPRHGSVGNVMLRQVLQGGFPGKLYAVNPNHREIDGVRCYGSLHDLPGPIDHVVLAVPDEHMEQAFDDAVQTGARAATIFSNLVLDADGDPPLRDRILERARQSDMILCGAMSMGFYNLVDKLWVCGFETRADHVPGGVSLITQSGSVLCALVDCEARIDYNLVVSSGLEMTTSVADYLDFALAMPSTCVVGLFLEAVRDVDGFVACLEKASRRRIPIVALKAGRTERSARFAASHSGAMVGDDGAFQALFDHYGVVRVSSLDELAYTLMLFAQPHTVGPGGLATIHDSGGERCLFAELAESTGTPFAELGAATRRQLETRLGAGLPASNPLDAWNTGRDYEGVFRECLIALMKDPDTAIGAVVCDRGPGGKVYPEYLRIVRDAHAASGKPLCIVSHHQGSGSEPRAVSFTREGFPVMDGALQFLQATRHLFDYRGFRNRPPAHAPGIAPEAVRRWHHRLTNGGVLSEALSMDLLADFGLPANPYRLVEDRRGAVEAAEALGYPVVLKTAEEGIAHKTDENGVFLELRDAASVTDAHDRLASSLGPRVIVAPHVSGGAEMFLGMAMDAQFGPIMMLGAGGIHAEVLRDVVFALPPLDEGSVRRLLEGLKLRPLLDAVRGRPPADVDSFCTAVTRFSAFVSEFADELVEVDINPIVVTPDGCVAVDALIVPRSSHGSPSLSAGMG